MSQLILIPEHHVIEGRTTVKVLCLLAGLFFMTASCVHQPMQGGRTITDNIIEAYGGRERLAKVTSVSADGRITALMRGDEGSYKRILRRDGKLFVDIVYRHSTEKRILNGKKGFRGTEAPMEEVFGPRYLAMVYQYNELNQPYGMLDHTYAVSDLRMDRLNNTVVRVLRVTDRAGNEMEMIINAKTYRILKCTGFFVIGTQSTSLSSEYSDFRFIDGVLLPFRIVNYASGNKISEITMTGYIINPPVDDTLFNP